MKPPFYTTSVSARPELVEDIDADIEADGRGSALHRGAHRVDAIGHPKARDLGLGEGAGDASGGERTAGPIVATHPIGRCHGVFQARQEASLAEAVIVKIFVRPLAEAELSGSLHGAFPKSRTGAHTKTIDTASPFVWRVSRFVEQGAERRLNQWILPDEFPFEILQMAMSLRGK